MTDSVSQNGSDSNRDLEKRLSAGIPLELCWLVDFAALWIVRRRDAMAFALDVLLKENNDKISRLPKEFLNVELHTIDGIKTVITVLSVVIDKINLLLAKSERLCKNDRISFNNIKSEMGSFAVSLKDSLLRAGEEFEPQKDDEYSISPKEVEDGINSILDEYSKGKITIDQMKTRMKEFASKTKSDIGKYGGNIIGQLI